MVIKGWGIEKAGISIAETRLWHIDAFNFFLADIFIQS